MTDSPCTNVCAIDDDDICVGCGRTLPEIASWTTMTEEERKTVLERVSTNADEKSEDT